MLASAILIGFYPFTGFDILHWNLLRAGPQAEIWLCWLATVGTKRDVEFIFPGESKRKQFCYLLNPKWILLGLPTSMTVRK